MKKTLSLHQLSKTVYPEHLKEKYNPLWRYRLKFLARGLFYVVVRLFGRVLKPYNDTNL